MARYICVRTTSSVRAMRVLPLSISGSGTGMSISGSGTGMSISGSGTGSSVLGSGTGPSPC